MKKHSQWARITFALNGVKTAWREEASFRTEVLLALPVYALMIVAGVSRLWWLAVGIFTAMALAAELVNTAIENICNAIHPEHHPLIGKAKDCAAGAVLVCNSAALVVVAAMVGRIFHLW